MNELLLYCLPVIPIVIGVTKGINTKLEKFGINSQISKEIVTLLVTAGAIIYYSLIVAKQVEIIMLVIGYIVIYFGASGIYQFTPKETVTGGQTPINSVLEDEEE